MTKLPLYPVDSVSREPPICTGFSSSILNFPIYIKNMEFCKMFSQISFRLYHSIKLHIYARCRHFHKCIVGFHTSLCVIYGKFESESIYSVFCVLVDTKLPLRGETFLQNAFLIVTSLCVISAVFPWFLIPLLPMAAVFIFLYRMFRVSLREVKRADNVTR